MTAALRRSTLSLSIPNYRRWFAGQVVSISGNWMQTVAEMWLVVHLTGSGVAVGITAALQFLPILLVGALGGVLADRCDKRRLLMLTQTLMAIPALTMFALTLAGTAQLWMVYSLVLIRGMVLAVDNPLRQSFVPEVVGPDRVVNAVSLNSVIVHTGRIVGPAIAGAVIAVFGLSLCFLLNAASFGAMLIAVGGMDRAALLPAPRAPRARGQVREALREVSSRPALFGPLAMMAVIGTLSFNFQVLLPLFAKFTWHGTASTYALLTTAMGVGSVCGALAAGARNRVTPRLLAGSALLFGAAELGAALAPTLLVQALILAPLGAASVTFAAGVNSSLQLSADSASRGRVMSLYSVVFLGSTPIGAPIVGWLAQEYGPRAGLMLGALAALATGAAAALWLRARMRSRTIDRDDERDDLALRRARAALRRRPSAPARPAVRSVLRHRGRRAGARERARRARARSRRRHRDAVGPRAGGASRR
jgi:MFS family permease